MIRLILLTVLLNIPFINTANAIDEWIIGTGTVHNAAYSPNGEYIATVGDLGLHIWNSKTNQLVFFKMITTGFNVLKWAPNNNYLLLMKVISDISVETQYKSVDNVMIDIESGQSISIDSEIIWYPFTENYTPISRRAFIHSNNINFSKDSSEFLLINTNNEIEIRNSINAELTDIISGNDEEFYAAGFTLNDGEIWYSTVIRPLHPLFRPDVKFVNFDRNENVIVNEFLLEDSSSFFYNVLEDGKQIYLHGVSFTDIGSFSIFVGLIKPSTSEFTTIASAGGVPQFSGITFIPAQEIYDPLLNRFVALVPNSNKTTTIVITDLETKNNVEIVRLDLVSKFLQPLSSDGMNYLVGNVDSDRFNLRKNIIYPNYDLYKVDWSEKQYEHILPQIAPSLIAFDNSSANQYFTHTNRISKQYFYSNSEGSFNLELLPNRFNVPVSQQWSPDEQSLINEFDNKSMHEIGVFSSDNALFASPIDSAGPSVTQVNLYDTNNWELVHELPVYASNTVNSVAFSPHNELVMVTHDYVDIWDVSTGERILTYMHLEGGNNKHAVFSSDSQRVLSVSDSGSILETNIVANTSNTIIQESSPVIFVDYISDETQALYVLDDGTANVINLSNKEMIKTIPSSLGEHPFRAVKLSVDERFLIVGNQIWDIETAEQVSTIAEHAERIEDIQVSSDGKWVASRHADFTARVWSTEDLFNSTSSINQFQNY